MSFYLIRIQHNQSDTMVFISHQLSDTPPPTNVYQNITVYRNCHNATAIWRRNWKMYVFYRIKFHLIQIILKNYNLVA